MGGFPQAASNILDDANDAEFAEHMENCPTKDNITNVIKHVDDFAEKINVINQEFNSMTPEQRDNSYNNLAKFAECHEDYDIARKSEACETCTEVLQAISFKVMFAILAFDDETNHMEDDVGASVIEERNAFFQKVLDFLKNTFDGIIPDSDGSGSDSE